MNIYSNNAVGNFRKGYNCAQSVLLTFSDKIGLSEKQTLMLASSFGGGMGRLREVCGAVSAMFMIAGFLDGYTEPNNDIIKTKHYQLIQDLASEFKAKFGTIICHKLLGLEKDEFSPIPSVRTIEYYQTRPCEEFIKYVAEIIEVKLLND